MTLWSTPLILKIIWQNSFFKHLFLLYKRSWKNEKNVSWKPPLACCSSWFWETFWVISQFNFTPGLKLAPNKSRSTATLFLASNECQMTNSRSWKNLPPMTSPPSILSRKKRLSSKELLLLSTRFQVFVIKTRFHFPFQTFYRLISNIYDCRLFFFLITKQEKLLAKYNIKMFNLNKVQSKDIFWQDCIRSSHL